LSGDLAADGFSPTSSSAFPANATLSGVLRF
jgi:hypothetical protein